MCSITRYPGHFIQIVKNRHPEFPGQSHIPIRSLRFPLNPENRIAAMKQPMGRGIGELLINRVANLFHSRPPHQRERHPFADHR